MTLPYRLDRVVTIQAPREIVFGFLTDNDRWASWWGAGSTIDPRVGGRVYIRHPGNVEVSGEVLSIRTPEQIVFTYGFVSGQPIPAGSSKVTIALETLGSATRLHLTHEFADESVQKEHVQGWRFQLALFSNAVSSALLGDASSKVDAWFATWAEPDAATRVQTLASIAASSVLFRDRYSLTEGVEDLSAHIAAAQRFMPGIRIARTGDIRQCQGMVLADWNAVGPDGSARGTGSNVFVFGADGRISSATGFWS